MSTFKKAGHNEKEEDKAQQEQRLNTSKRDGPEICTEFKLEAKGDNRKEEPLKICKKDFSNKL
jgi:hypothetical protein